MTRVHIPRQVKLKKLYATDQLPEAAKEPFALVAQKLLEKEVEAILADETIQKVHSTCILGMCGYQIVTDLKT